MRKIASIENFEANAVDDFRVFLARSQFLIRHESEEDRNYALYAEHTQILTEGL
jgi:hypothetical protein